MKNIKRQKRKWKKMKNNSGRWLQSIYCLGNKWNSIFFILFKFFLFQFKLFLVNFIYHFDWRRSITFWRFSLERLVLLCLLALRHICLSRDCGVKKKFFWTLFPYSFLRKIFSFFSPEFILLSSFLFLFFIFFPPICISFSTRKV